jgi:predicted transcriptional regulator
MKQDILIYLFSNNGASAGDIALNTGHHPREVQDLLIQMDDAGDVIMKNGMYRLSEVSRLRAVKRFDDGTI